MVLSKLTSLTGIDTIKTYSFSNTTYFKANIITNGNSLVKLTKNPISITVPSDNHATYIDLRTFLSIFVRKKDDASKEKIIEFLLETLSAPINTTPSSEQPPTNPPEPLPNILPPTNPPEPPPSTNPTTNIQTATTSTSNNSTTPSKSKKRKPIISLKEQDKNNKENSKKIPIRNLEREQQIAETENNKRKERDTPNKNKNKKKQKKAHNNNNQNKPTKKKRNETRRTDLLKLLPIMHKKFDSVQKEQADISRMNLTAEINGIRTTTITHDSTKRVSWKNSMEKAIKSAENCMKTYCDLAHQCNFQFCDLLVGYFAQHPQEMIELVHAVKHMETRLKNVNKKDFSSLRNLNFRKSLSRKLQLKLKDELGLSNTTWREMAYALDSDCDGNLSKITKEVNGLIVEYFKFGQVANGFRVEIRPLLTAIVKAHLHQMYVREHSCYSMSKNEDRSPKKLIMPKTNSSNGLCLPDKVEVKISMDGRTFGDLRTVVVTMQVFNLATYSSQEPQSVFPIAMYIGEESHISKYIEGFKDEVLSLSGEEGLEIVEDENDANLGIKTLVSSDSGLQVERKSLKLMTDFYWISDLKSLSYVSDLLSDNHFCPCCDCKRGKTLQTLSDPNSCNTISRELNHAFGIRKGNIFFCVLHMDERVTEYIMKMTIRLEATENKVLKSLRSIPGFANFNFTVAPVGANSSTTEEAEKFSLKDVKEYSFMLSGGHCGKIFGSLDKVVGFLDEDETTKPMYKIWCGWKSIRKWLYLTNDQLATKTLEEFKKLQIEIREWCRHFEILKKDTESVGDYIHIAVKHLTQVIATIGSLVPLSNQGVENSHKHDRWIMQRCTSRGKMMKGTKKRKANTSTFQVEINSVPAEHIPPTSNEFSYDTTITATDTCSWNELYVIAQIMMKKLRILYLSFTEEDVVFKRLEKKPGAVVNAFWTRDLSSLLSPPKFTPNPNIDSSQPNLSQTFAFHDDLFAIEDPLGSFFEDGSPLLLSHEQIEQLQSARSYEEYEEEQGIFTEDAVMQDQEEEEEEDIFLEEHEEHEEHTNYESDEEDDVDDIFGYDKSSQFIGESNEYSGW